VGSFLCASRFRGALSILLALVGGPLLSAQDNGAIRLELKDPAGAAVQVSGTLRNLDTGAEQSFRTNVRGSFDFANLQYGRYEIRIEKEGFATQTVRVEVRSATAVRETVTLVLSAQTSTLNVISVAPLPGSTLSKDDVAMNVQTATAADIQKSGAIDLSDFLNRKLGGVYVNNNQENPFQPDLNYRGYTASPLLGTPEGMSVYVDGVRQNQPFGDVVAWDLIPKIAIQDMALVPGSDPVFGLNTLGAAVTVRTKDGRSAPGVALTVDGGSFGRREGSVEYGGYSKGLNWYLAGDWFREDGWRLYSPSQVRQTFGKVGYTFRKTNVSLGFGYVDNNLTGNGSTDTRFLAQNYKAVNTIPDITWNRSPSLTLNVSHNVNTHFTLAGAAYLRYVRADTTNGDLNDDSFTGSLYDLSDDDIAALTAAGYSGFPVTGDPATQPFPYWACIAQALEMGDPDETCTGVFTRTYDKQHAWGASGQGTWSSGRNSLTVGASWDRSSLTYQQAGQFGYLNPDNVSITPINSFEDGSTSSDDGPIDTRVNLHGLTNAFGIYATDVVHVRSNLSLTLSGRFNHAAIQNIDRLPVTDPDVRGSLNGSYTFNRFNPSVGVVYTPIHFASLYFSYSEANRAPTAIELGCADPTQPCNLPNALVADPPLKQVVAKTFEAGIRSAGEYGFNWHAGWFRAQNTNDILFVASQQTGFGYFTNYGKTLRQGAEISVSRTYRWMTLGGNYTLLDATFQSSQTLGAGSNSTNDSGPGEDGDIQVMPGDRIPQTPRTIFKAYADLRPTSKLSILVDFNAVGRSFARGNENNLDQPDGVYYLGPGFSPGYGVTNVGAHYQVRKQLQIFVQIDNIFDHHYYTAAQLNTTPFDNAGHLIPQPFGDDSDAVRNSTFYSPGAPRGIFGGMKITF